MVEQTEPFTPEQQAAVDVMIAKQLTKNERERFARTKAAQAAYVNSPTVPQTLAAPSPPERAIDRRLGKTLEFWFAGGTALLLYVTDLLQQPEFTGAVGRIGEAAMTDGSLDVGKLSAALVAAVVFLGRQYAKAKAAQGAQG